MSQTKATTCTQHHDTSTWKVGAAPGHEEVIWGNLRCCILATSISITIISLALQPFHLPSFPTPFSHYAPGVYAFCCIGSQIQTALSSVDDLWSDIHFYMVLGCTCSE